MARASNRLRDPRSPARSPEGCAVWTFAVQPAGLIAEGEARAKPSAGPDKTSVVQRVGIAARRETKPTLGVVAWPPGTVAASPAILSRAANGAVVAFNVVGVSSVTAQDARALLAAAAGDGGTHDVIEDLVLPSSTRGFCTVKEKEPFGATAISTQRASP